MIPALPSRHRHDLTPEANPFRSTTERVRQEAIWRSNSRSASRTDVRAAKRGIEEADTLLDEIRPRYETLASPQRDRLNESISALMNEQAALELRGSERRHWLTDHPETIRRLRHLDSEVGSIDRSLAIQRDVLDGIDAIDRPWRSVADERRPPLTREPTRERDLGLGL